MPSPIIVDSLCNIDIYICVFSKGDAEKTFLLFFYVARAMWASSRFDFPKQKAHSSVVFRMLQNTEQEKKGIRNIAVPARKTKPH